MRRVNHSMPFARTAIVTLAFLSLGAFPRFANAEPSIGTMMRFPGFRNMVFTIAMVNKAMRDAAENPQDQWRRQNVQRAVAMIPAAMQGLAGDYLAGNLSPQYFPMVQALLGGFVDQSAPDGYKKFLANPSRHNIPQVGKGFPVVTPPPVPASVPASYAGGDTLKGSTSVVAKESSPVLQSPEIASLSDGRGIPEKAGSANPERLGFDDSAKKNSTSDSVSGASNAPAYAAPGGSESLARDIASLPSSGGPVASNGAPGPTGSKDFLQQASRDISGIEASVGSSDRGDLSIQSVRRGELSPSNAQKERDEDKEFFGTIGKAEKEVAKKKRGRDTANAFKLKVKPKYWSTNPAVLLIEKALLAKVAHAESQGGGQGEGQTQDGGAANGQAAMAIAQILFGVAAIIAALQPAQIAKIQAEADIKIAEINADTQKELTKTTADTSKYLADQQKTVALKQSELASDISQRNNDAVTQRLNLQLAQLDAARKDARQAEQQRQALDQLYNEQRIQLARDQAAANQELARQTLKAQLAQAGATSGYSSTTSSFGGLGITNANGSSSVASAGGSAGFPSAGGGGLGARESSDTVSSTSVASAASVGDGSRGAVSLGAPTTAAVNPTGAQATVAGDGASSLAKANEISGAAGTRGALLASNTSSREDAASKNFFKNGSGSAPDENDDEGDATPGTRARGSRANRRNALLASAKSGTRSLRGANGTSKNPALGRFGSVLGGSGVAGGSTPGNRKSDLTSFVMQGNANAKGSWTDFRATNRAPASVPLSAPIAAADNRPIRTVSVPYNEPRGPAASEASAGSSSHGGGEFKMPEGFGFPTGN